MRSQTQYQMLSDEFRITVIVNGLPGFDHSLLDSICPLIYGILLVSSFPQLLDNSITS